MIEVNISFSPCTVRFFQPFQCSCFVMVIINAMNVWIGAEGAEEKFKEVVKSYEAIKLERKNGVS